MRTQTIGVLLGLGAAVAFEVSYLLLAGQARRVTRAVRPGVRFLGRLARRRWWLAAMGLNGLAFVLELEALRRVPLVIVQPLLAVGLIGLVFGARAFLGERVGPRRIAGVALVAVGVTLVVAGTPATGGATGLRADAASFVAVAALLAVLLFPQFAHAGSAWPLVAAAGAGDTLVALATNEAAVAWSRHLALAFGAVLIVAVCGLTAITSESAALQRLPASRVGPIVSAVQVTLPVLLVALLGRQRWGSAPAGGALLALGVILAGGGAFCLGAIDVDETFGG
jgi:drug/metabolite transporter (DMT)-like permease